MHTFTINPNDCQAGKAYKLSFRTGAHKNKKHDKRHDRRAAKAQIRKDW